MRITGRVNSIPLDLEQRWLVVPRGYPSDVLTFDTEDGRQSISIRSRLRVNDVDFAEGAAWQNTGLAVLPDWMVGHRSALEPVLSDYVLARIPIRLVFRMPRSFLGECGLLLNS